MSRTPYVTALIDTYNHERFIAEAIESVLAQDFPASEMEILVVDDGSTDATPEIVRRYADRVRYIRKENGGQASALNLGFAEARGEIVAMLDGDDVWLPQKVRRVVEEFQQHAEAGMVYHPYQFWLMEEGRSEDDRSFTPLSGYLPERPENMLILGGLGTHSMAMRRSHALELLPIPEACVVFADAYLICTAIFEAPVVALKECLTRYRHHEDNLTAFTSKDPGRLRRMIECSSAATRGAQEWYERRGGNPNHEAWRVMVERRELLVRFAGYPETPPGRVEFFRYLMDVLRLYRPVWSPRYCWYRRALAVACLPFGYAGYSAFQQWYARNPVSQAIRKWLFPSDSSLGPAHAS
jgi:glycosyltransferase involved in cell wall biosynthesis